MSALSRPARQLVAALGIVPVDGTALSETRKQALADRAAVDVSEDGPTPDLRYLNLPELKLQAHVAAYPQKFRRHLNAEIGRLLTVSYQEPDRDS